MDKKKHHFLQLVIIFSSIVVLGLLSAWGYRGNFQTEKSMMGQSMGSMMQSMHARNITIEGLLVQEKQMEMMTGMESHHETADIGLKSTHYITTAAIVILLPFIIAGAVFLGIVWLK